MAKSWTQQDTGYLKRYAGKKTLDELARRFDAEPDEVREKLAALGLKTKDGEPSRSGAAAIEDEPEVEVYAAALEAMHGKKWKKARELFERVLAETDRAALAGRARQHIAAIERRTADAGADEVEDPYLRAVLARNRGELDEALEIVRGQGRKDADGRYAYLAASLHAVEGRNEDAVAALEKAVAADPANRVRAFHDADFAELRKDREHAHLFGLD